MQPHPWEAIATPWRCWEGATCPTTTPREFVEEAARRRLLGLRFPQGLGWTDEIVALEEVGVLGTSLACLYSLPSIVFRDAYVPPENLIGREGGGEEIFNQMMIPERMTSAAGAPAAHGLAVEEVRDRGVVDDSEPRDAGPGRDRVHQHEHYAEMAMGARRYAEADSAESEQESEKVFE